MVRQKRVAEEYLSHNLDEGHWGYLVPFLPRAAARHMVTTKSQVDFFSRNLFSQNVDLPPPQVDIFRTCDATETLPLAVSQFWASSRQILESSCQILLLNSLRAPQDGPGSYTCV